MISLTCEVCGSAYLRFPYQVRLGSKYCSMECRSASQNRPIQAACEQCGANYVVAQYRHATRFCSASCRSRNIAAKHPFGNGHKLGNTFRAGKTPTNAFTSEQVRGSANPKWVESVPLTCVHCQSAFSVKPWMLRHKSKSGRVFCSRRCFVESGVFRANNSPCYRGGPNGYRGRNWTTQRLVAVVRDKGACRKCGKHVGDSIPVHHIKPFRLFPTAEEANSAENLICLCQSCHMRLEPRTAAVA